MKRWWETITYYDHFITIAPSLSTWNWWNQNCNQTQCSKEKKKNLGLGLCFSAPSLVNKSNSSWAMNSPIELPCLRLVYLFGVTVLSPVGCRDTGVWCAISSSCSWECAPKGHIYTLWIETGEWTNRYAAGMVERPRPWREAASRYQCS